MESQKNQHEQQPSPAAATPSTTSCRKKKSEQASFLEDVKDHIDDFIHASMDEHKTCFKKTVQKVCSHFKLNANIACSEMFSLVNWFTSDSDWIIVHSFSDV